MQRLTTSCSTGLRVVVRWYQTKTGVFGHAPQPQPCYRTPAEVLKARANNSNFYRLVTAYRDHGHRTAGTNPVSFDGTAAFDAVDLNPQSFGLQPDQTVRYEGITWVNRGKEEGRVIDAVHGLRETYCGHATVELAGLEEEERDWLAERMERGEWKIDPSDKESRRTLLGHLLKSQITDQFLATKFGTLKRYGGEGAESMMAFFWQLLDGCKQDGVTDIVLAMSHRGRIDLLTAFFRLPPALVFRKIKGLLEFPDCSLATGDVLSHLTCSVDMGSVHVTMLPNPSHLEVANPVSVGKVRAKQLGVREGGYGDGTTEWGTRVLNVQVHGDAAFIGQGVNQETLSISRAPHFEVGGSIHLIVNNQVGFTTPADRGRSSRYSSDLAKMTRSPVLQVNGDHPEEVARITRVALAYQRRFRRDVFVEINCFRQWGHNEMDDPTFTNPALYRVIHGRTHTVPDAYASHLVEEGVMTEEEVAAIKTGHHAVLNRELKRDDYTPEQTYLQKNWAGVRQAGANITTWDTGMNTEVLRYIGTRSVATPEGFTVHPHLAKTHVNARLARMHSAQPVLDWATAEALAMGSLMYQGFNVRISGQDVGRGTFSQRHAMLVDQKSNEIYIPLNNLSQDQAGHLEVANSILSEEAVLGFEYGFSLEHPNNLVIWEAQFGDFFNGAQVMVDTLLTGGETKWMKSSGLVMLLPHGYDGAGPEHSSCRVERFLQLTDSSETQPDSDNVNMQVAVPSTPAQYFHLLRRQMIRNYRKPLVVVGPKTLLRLAEASSLMSEMGANTHFHNVLLDRQVAPDSVTKVVFVCGKHYYSLDKERRARGLHNTALVRVESLVPFPVGELQAVTREYRRAKKFVWSQEEPRNMGAWSFVKTRFDNMVGVSLEYAGLPTLATPAYGTAQAHNASQRRTIEDTLA